MIEERPELEAQRNGLVMQSVDNQHRLLEIENRILEVCPVSVTLQYAYTCVRKCFGRCLMYRAAMQIFNWSP